MLQASGQLSERKGTRGVVCKSTSNRTTAKREQKESFSQGRWGSGQRGGWRGKGQEDQAKREVPVRGREEVQ